MKRSTDRILTTHVGSLVRPHAIVDAMRREELGEPLDPATFERDLSVAVRDVVLRQVEAGVDVPSDGEFGKSGWSRYVLSRLGGIEYRPAHGITTTAFSDRSQFAGFYDMYDDLEQRLWLTPEEQLPRRTRSITQWECTGKISYIGSAAVARDIANFKTALNGLAVGDAFMPCAAPCSVHVLRYNGFYKDDDEFVYAAADALKHEYKAIVDAGFLLQVDDAYLPMHYDPHGSVEEYLRWVDVRVDALNQALPPIAYDTTSVGVVKTSRTHGTSP